MSLGFSSGALRGLSVLLLMAALSACTASRPPAAYMPSRDGIMAGETITVQPNQNVYTVAQEHNVSMREIIVLNDLKPPYTIKAGQRLTLPAGGDSFGGTMKAPAAAPRDEVQKDYLPPIMGAPVSEQKLEPVAQPHASAAPQALSAPVQQPFAQAQPQPQPQPQPQTVTEPVRVLNQPTPPQKQVATTLAQVSSPTTTASAASAIEMKWPVQGTILSSFGSKGAGLNNDGVNIGAPKGAPVVAAAGGTVVYAGNEMKGFGNLVLIRHQDDWVTAYAHLDRVMVKKDMIVAQGDQIGTVGKTGNVSSPQLHFETRQGSKAVDPASVVKN